MFGTNASLTYVPQLQYLWREKMLLIYSMYRADEDFVHRACCERATQPYSLGGGGVRFVQAQDQQVLLDVVRDNNCVFTHSLDDD